MTCRPAPVFLLTLLLLLPLISAAQKLQPGFSREEYTELMYISARTGALNENYYADIPAPANFRLHYRSRVMGLDNLWELWGDGGQTVVLSLRGTTNKTESWMANFYAAMLPARGTLELGHHEPFHYELASDSKAYVHAGWLISTAYLSGDILPKIDSCYQSGTKNILIFGHSQGGAIAYLLRAHLGNLQKKQKLPEDICFKTYCSAGPKPGNLYFAYEYETMTAGGWGFNVVNTADWVPETPISIQTLDDFNPTNPFLNVKPFMKKQKFPRNIMMNHVYKKLDKPTRKAQKAYERYLGMKVARMVIRFTGNFSVPPYAHSNHYVRTGTTVVLPADTEYYKVYPDNTTDIFVHHFHKPYLHLLQKL